MRFRAMLHTTYIMLIAVIYFFTLALLIKYNTLNKAQMFTPLISSLTEKEL